MIPYEDQASSGRNKWSKACIYRSTIHSQMYEYTKLIWRWGWGLMGRITCTIGNKKQIWGKEQHLLQIQGTEVFPLQENEWIN